MFSYITNYSKTYHFEHFTVVKFPSFCLVVEIRFLYYLIIRLKIIDCFKVKFFNLWILYQLRPLLMTTVNIFIQCQLSTLTIEKKDISTLVISFRYSSFFQKSILCFSNIQKRNAFGLYDYYHLLENE